MKIISEKLTGQNLTKVLFVYALICLVAAFIMSFNSGKVISQSVDMTAGEVGPVEVAKDNSVYLVEVFQSVTANSWTSITIDVLDQDKQYLFSFGDELWHESGYDSEGSWVESHNSFSLKITFPKKGSYYLALVGEKSDNNGNTYAQVTVSKKMGSSLAFSVVGVLSLLIAVGIWFFRNKDNMSSSTNRSTGARKKSWSQSSSGDADFDSFDD